MRFTLDTYEYVTGFFYRTIEEAVAEGVLSTASVPTYSGRPLPSDTRMTFCRISETDGSESGAEPKEIALGFTFCGPTERFEKAAGRRLAFTVALEQAGFSREERSVAWEAYHNRATVVVEVVKVHAKDDITTEALTQTV